MIIPDKTFFDKRVNLQERNIIRNYPEFYYYLINNHNIYPGRTIQEQIYMYYNDMHEPHKCEFCGKPTKFLSFHKGYRRFCSGRCTTQDPNRIGKAEQTWILKYGENYRENFYKKGKQTKLDRYGDENYNNIEKGKQTKLDRYGDENYNNIDKTKQTCLTRYGVNNPFQSIEVQKKSKQTKFDRYGDENYNNIGKAKQTKLDRYGDENYNNIDKTKQTCLTRYGVNNPLQSIEIQEKVKQTNLIRYGVEWGILNKQIRAKNEASRRKFYIEKHDLINIDTDGAWICKCPHQNCNKCTEKYYKITSIQFYGRKQTNIEPCTRLLPINPNSNTYIESFVRNILDKYNIEYIANDRSVLGGKELDIYIPSKKIAIECNGCYWHSLKEPSYHINKYKECKEKGIQLLTIWEDQIVNKSKIVESIILSKLGLIKNKIYARCCHIKELDSKTCAEFLELNHIQGQTNTSVKIGLYNENDLVAVMTFSKRSKLSGASQIHESEWELNRFCTLLGYQIIGGASKLLKYFIKKYNPTSVISFASNDISNGNLYKILGFVEDSKITKAYWYIRKNDLNRYHRTLFTKSNLKKMGHDIENKTESELMSNLPYWKIYDSGHVKYNLSI